MTSQRRQSLLSLAACCVLLLEAVRASTPAAAQSNCYTDWSVARPIIKRERLATVERLSELALEKDAGDIVKTTLCRDRGRFVYRLMVRNSHGALRTLVVDAKRPFER